MIMGADTLVDPNLRAVVEAETSPGGAVMVATMNCMATDLAKVGPLLGAFLLLCLRCLYDLSFERH